ncbi:hypothetical protein ABZZ47_32760 [Streptomyces sp. NPDC006465]|uniref:hypothetical protein n=1 Tax=Streptomyces sp. NPDC006465 TaxID=3157174 RepID=UPI0033A8B518
MRHGRRLVALAAVLAALGAAPADAAAGRADGHPGAPVHADRAPGTVSPRLGAAAGQGAPRNGREAYRDGRDPGEDKGAGREGARTDGAGRTDPFVVAASALAGVGALVALVLSVSRALRRRRG